MRRNLLFRAVAVFGLGLLHSAYCMEPPANLEDDPASKPPALDCSQPPKVEFPSTDDTPLQGSLALQRRLLKQAAHAQDLYAAFAMPNAGATQKRVAEVARLQIEPALAKINAFLAAYCNLAPVTADDMDTYISADAVRVIDPEKWPAFVRAAENPPTRIAFYRLDQDKLYVRGSDTTFESHVPGHEFMHRILAKKYATLHIGWHHALLRGNPAHGFLGWGAYEDRYGIREGCSWDKFGLEWCSTNDSWRLGVPDADSSTLVPAENPPALQKRPVTQGNETMPASPSPQPAGTEPPPAPPPNPDASRPAPPQD